MDTKVDTTVLTFTGFSRSAIGREMDIVGEIFTFPKEHTAGPLTGKYGAYVVVVDEISEPPAKEDYGFEKSQHEQTFSQRVATSLYKAIEKKAEITDNRIKFY